MRNFRMPLILLAVVYYTSAWSQPSPSSEYANTITAADLREHLEILASETLEGRETGQPGQKMAATYIEYHFKANGLTPMVPTSDGPSYLQKFNLFRISQGQAWIKMNEMTIEHGRDFIYTGKRNFTHPEKTELVFVGAGNEGDYKATSVEGKNVILLVGGESVERNQKVELAYRHGAKNVFIIFDRTDEEFATILNRYSRFTTQPYLTLPPETVEPETGYFLLPMSIGVELLNANKATLSQAVDKAGQGKYASMLKLRTGEVTFYAHQMIEEVGTENVLGFVEGTDKKDELVIVSAHYDHIGMVNGVVNPGADDDGSGTVAVLEMAQAFALAKKAGNGPRRSMLFLAVTGEEKGLLGSTYYVANPVVPLKNTVTDLNIDMIGRTDKEHEQNKNYIYLIGADKLSKELHALSEQANATYTMLELDYKYNDEKDPNRFYYRSDHYNFAKNNIPVIFYFNGVHEDYHRPTDTIDKIDFDLMEKRARLIFYTAWEIANREDRIRVDVFPQEVPLKESK